ncbi:MAG: DUF4097 domain-containing protein [Bacilli bacterium]|nr:DUF4097 domain-containing protein [Bacilli bacterium]
MKKRWIPCVAALAWLASGCAGVIVVHVGDYTYDHADQYKEYTNPLVWVTQGNITSMHIGWLSGQINVKVGENFFIEEYNAKGNYLPLYYWVQDTSISIQYCASGTKGGKLENSEKTLDVTIPSTFGKLDIDAVSASYSIKAENLGELNVDSVSGDGEVNVQTIEKARMDSVSGSFSLTCFDSSKIMNIRTDSVSGNTDLTFDGKRGYDLDYDTVSGKKTWDFVDGSDPTLSRFSIDVNSVSGNLAIHKLAA